MNTVNLKNFPAIVGICLKIISPDHSTLEGFILKVNSHEISVVACSFSIMLVLTFSNVLFEKLTSETGNEFENHPMHYMALRVEISYKARLLVKYL